MDNAPKREGVIQGFLQRIPSVLSNNRMLIAVIAFLYLLPLSTTSETSPVRSLLFLITQILIWGILAMSFDLQLGRAGLLNFGHVALFGIGAYIMAFTLDASILPFPFNLISLIPYPITIVLAMVAGAFIGLIMGLTTNRMRGTAFAFIALAIAMFLFNFFAENNAISGGETGLRVSTPSFIRTAPFYIFFVALAIISIAAFIGMIVLFLKKRTSSIGLILLIPIMIVFPSVLLIFGTNIIGPAIVFIAFLGLIVYYWIERRKTITNPFQYTEKRKTTSEQTKPSNPVINSILPLGIVIIAIIGVLVSFGSNIVEMVSLWFEHSDTFFYTIPVQYYLVLTCVVLTYVFVKRLVVSPFGRMVVAIAQNEERADALGFNSYYCKIVVLMISGAIASMAGALYAPFIRTIDPNTVLGVGVTIDAMLFTIIGGIGTLLGPLLGAGVVEYSNLYLVDFLTGLNLPGELWLVVLGVIYIFIVLFMPYGIVGTIKSKAPPIKEKLQNFKLGSYDVGIKESDYWVFAFLGIVCVFVLMLIVSL